MKKIITALMLISILFIITSCNDEETNQNSLNEDTIINDFLKNSSSYYQTLDTNDYQITLSLIQLNTYFDNHLDNIFIYQLVNIISEKESYSSISDVYKDILILSTLNKEITNTIKSYLNNLTFEQIESWNYAYAYISLTKTSLNPSLQKEIKDYFNNNFNNIYLDVDTSSMYIISNIANDENETKLLNIINESLTPDGVTSYGNANSCSTAMVILALLSQNINPTNYQNYNLIEILTKYYQENNFKWLLTDQNVDLLYATPQSILALSSYYIYKQTNQKVNLLG